MKLPVKLMKLPVKLMNKLVKVTAMKQNKKGKLNAGQYREVIKQLFTSIEIDLLPEEKELIKKMIGGL